jgi:hypothetical protein
MRLFSKVPVSAQYIRVHILISHLALALQTSSVIQTRRCERRRTRERDIRKRRQRRVLRPFTPAPVICPLTSPTPFSSPLPIPMTTPDRPCPSAFASASTSICVPLFRPLTESLSLVSTPRFRLTSRCSSMCPPSFHSSFIRLQLPLPYARPAIKLSGASVDMAVWVDIQRSACSPHAQVAKVDKRVHKLSAI